MISCFHLKEAGKNNSYLLYNFVKIVASTVCKQPTDVPPG